MIRGGGIRLLIQKKSPCSQQFGAIMVESILYRFGYESEARLADIASWSLNTDITIQSKRVSQRLLLSYSHNV